MITTILRGKYSYFLLGIWNTGSREAITCCICWVAESGCEARDVARDPLLILWLHHLSTSPTTPQLSVSETPQVSSHPQFTVRHKINMRYYSYKVSKMCVCKLLSHDFATPWAERRPLQALLSMEFFRTLEWVAISFFRALPHPGIEPTSPISPAFQADSLPAEPLGKLKFLKF